ncbi:MAG TPA: antibiotic biosynthesis monooxygenase family protein [Micromonosporaceae bacterium]
MRRCGVLDRGVVDVLVVNRFIVPGEPGDRSGGPSSRTGEQDFVDRAHAAIRALGACEGFVRARLGRAADDPRCWCLVTEWRSVGAYRRALSSYQVKLDATPLLAEAEQEPSAYEVLAASDGGEISVSGSDRAPGV